MKKIISLLLAVTLLLSITGCHGSTEEKVFRIPDTFDTSRQYEISFWAKNDTNMTQVEIYKQAIADFEALYPNITVNLRLYTDYGKIYNDVITNIATETTPNVCITYPDHIATYMTATTWSCRWMPSSRTKPTALAAADFFSTAPLRTK